MAAVCLTDFLGEMARRPKTWPARSCLLICADWAAAVCGRDPAEGWRGFATEGDALAAIRTAGGAARVAGKAMDAIGARGIAIPKAGDVALVWTPCRRADGRLGRRATAAICVNAGKFAFLTPDLGFLIAPAPLIKAWRLDGR